MAGPRPDSFQKALTRFKNTLDPSLVNEFSVCNLRDVRDVCQDIQNTHGREGRLRYMERIKAFIEAMEQFGKVIELFVNVSEIVCFIWIARTYVDSFDKLLDVYNQVGNAIPGLLRYQTAFEEHPPLATVLEDYYSDILGFHQAALSIFTRPRWKKLFHSTWKTFDSKFGPILQSISKRRELLESEKGSATLYEIQKLREEVSHMQAEQRRRTAQEDIEKHKRQVSYIHEKLEAPDYRIDQEMSTEDRHGNSLGMWIFEDPNFRSWSNNETTGHDVNGVPGAGKTTLMSAIIEKLLDRKCSAGNKHCVAYFYFKQKQPNKESHNSLLRAVLAQLIDRDPTISDYLFEKIFSIDGVNLRATKMLEKLVKKALESYPLSYIVLDGLDECAPNEATKSVNWFLSLTDGGLKGANAVLRVLFCGQRDGNLEMLLADQSSISLETSGHAEDIRQYCRDFCGRIRRKFNIQPEMEEMILFRVTKEAQSMFLYARVVLENLLNQTKLSRLRQEIEPGTFPQGIEKAYERVAVRIFETSSLAEREDATKILGWITCARRFLRWREIQSLFCIDPINGDVDYEERRLRVTCKELCGSLVDVHYAKNKKTGPEDMIKIVHESAREYLVRRKWLDARLEHARIAIFCSRYLTSKPFSYGIKDEDVVIQAVKGYYGLQDYAVQYWFDHFRECTKSIMMLHPDQLREVMESARVFLASYALPSKIANHYDTSGHEGVAMFLKELPEDRSERNAYFNLELRTTLIRNIMETIQRPVLNHTQQETVLNLHGEIASYKCTKPWCGYFTDGFKNGEDRKQHINRHDLPFSCPSERCFAFHLGYDTQAKLDKHKKSHHPKQDDDDGIVFPKIATKRKATLMVAASRGDLDTVRALLDAGNSVRGSKRRSGESPLYMAAISGHFEVCKVLLERGAEVNLANDLGRTPLHAAVESGNRDIVHLLLSQGECLPDKADTLNRSPFCVACASGRLDMVKLLLETGKIQPDRRPNSNPDYFKNESRLGSSMPLDYACREGHLAVVQYLLHQGLSTSVDWHILARAAEQGHTAIVDLLHPIAAENKPLSLCDWEDVPILSKKVREGWSVIFNPAILRVLDVDLVHILNATAVAHCMRFSPDGKHLAIGSTNAQIYDVTTGGELHTLESVTPGIRPPRVQFVCFSPDSKYLATGDGSYQQGLAGYNAVIRVWDIAMGAIHNKISGSDEGMTCLEFGRGSREIVFGSPDGAVRLWDIETDAASLLVSTDHAINTIALSPDSKFLAAASGDNCVRMWDIQNGSLVEDFELPDGSTDEPCSIVFSPDGRKFLSGGSDDTLKVWELTAPERIAAQGPKRDRSIKMFEGHKDIVRNVAFTSDGQLVLSGSVIGQVGFWNPCTGQQQFKLHAHLGPLFSMATSPTGGYFATSSSDETVRIWKYTKVDGA
ncbi:WD40 repeat-like protein [Ustulina deusta]|nr:WD40 repeat-like protein [Ustulina deusta]